MMVLAIGVTIFLLTYILPKFTPLFKSQGHAAAEADADHDGALRRHAAATGTLWLVGAVAAGGRLPLRPAHRAGPQSRATG